MRGCVIVAGLVAAIGLSACGDAQQEAAAPAAPKSGARSVQFYAGQGLIAKVGTGSIEVDPRGGLKMQVSGDTDGPGYINLGFLPRINAYPPKDGIYEVDVVADKPAAPAAAAPTTVEVKGEWSAYPVDHLKGVKFMAKANAVTAMLPAKG